MNSKNADDRKTNDENIENVSRIEKFLKAFQEVKDSYFIIESINKDFFLEFGECLIQEREQDKARIKELEIYQNMAVEIIENSILIDKIKDKIEELKQEKEKLNYITFLRVTDVLQREEELNYKIQVLEKLLENKGE